MPPTNNPYVGPRPFGQDEHDRFFGRDREANELFSLINAHPVILFYSQSGAGKTSLLNAAIIPRLKEQGDEVRGVARVGGKLPKETNEVKLSNVFVFNALLSLQGERKQFLPEQLSRMSLLEYLKSQERGEERQYFYPLNVVFFDQFEEFFTSFPKRTAQQEGFFVNVSKALEADPLLRIVFTMREEYIAALDPFARMLPGRLKWRFRLERLREQAALRAVVGPLEGTDRYFGKGVAEKLVNNLMQVPIKYVGGTVPMTGEYVEPVQLQIVCHGLWEVLPLNVRKIDERAVAQFGDVDNALANYYSDALKKVVEAREKAGKPADEKGLRIWFEKSLITPIGTRGTVYMDEGRTEDELSEPVVKMLEDLRLIRPELRGGATWYELTHDRFIEPIRQSNREWFGSLPEDDRFVLELEQKAREWKEKGSPSRAEELLADEERRKLSLVWGHHTNLKAKATATLNEYVAESRRAAERRRREARRRRNRIVALVVIVALALVASTIFSSFKAWQASRIRKDAEIRRGDLAKQFADVKGKEYDALAFGVEAVGMSNEPSPEAVEGLREALAVIDSKVWLREGAGIPSTLELSADGALAITASSSEFFVWDSSTGELLSAHPAPKDGEWRRVAFSPDGRFLYAISAHVRRDPSQSMIEQGGASTPSSAALADAETVLIIGARGGEQWAELQGRVKGARGLIVSENGRYILADMPGDVRIIDTTSRNVSSRFPETQLQWRQIALSPDGSRVVAVYADSRVGILASDTGQAVSGFNVGVPRGQGRDFIAFSPDGHRIAVARPSSNGETLVAIGDDSGGQRTLSFRVRVGTARHAAFSRDGRSVVIVGDARGAIYDASAGQTLERPLPLGVVAHYSGPNALFIHNGNGKSTVFMWDALRGETEVLAQADSAQYKFTRASATPDAAHIITASEDNVIQVWTPDSTFNVAAMSPDELLRNACAKLLDTKRAFGMVADQCKRYAGGP